MNDPAKALSESHDVSTKVAQMLQTRTQDRDPALRRARAAVRASGPRPSCAAGAGRAWQLWTSGARYAVDFAQRSILLWDTLRQRGNNYLEHEQQGSRRCCTSSTKW